MILALLLGLRHAPDRLLHAGRRQALSDRILGLRMPNSVLFLCHGNVCRSPFAAKYLQGALSAKSMDGSRIRSAGFVGPDRGSPAEALLAAARYGVDLSAHVSALVTPADVAESEWVVVMSAKQARRVRREFPGHRARIIVLGDADPLPIAKRTILDPWNGDVARFDESYGRIVRCVDALAAVWR